MVFPLYSIVVQLTAGIVTDLVWDDGCFGGQSNCFSYNVGTNYKIIVGRLL